VPGSFQLLVCEANDTCLQVSEATQHAPLTPMNVSFEVFKSKVAELRDVENFRVFKKTKLRHGHLRQISPVPLTDAVNL
jgi:hypothetical protein